MGRRTSRNSVFNKRSNELVASSQNTQNPTNLLPEATAQLQNTNPTVSTGGQYQGPQQHQGSLIDDPDNTANVPLERDASEYSSDHSIERFFTNIGRGAVDAGESYSTDIAAGLTGNTPIRHMKDSTLVDVFMAGAMEGRLHDSWTEANRRITEEPGRVIGEVASEAGVMLGTMGAAAAIKGVRAGAMGAKVIQGISPTTGKAVTGYQRSSTGLKKYFGRTLFGNNLKPKTTYVNNLSTTTGKLGKDGIMKWTTQSNKPTLFDPARPIARYIERAAQPLGESLRTGINKLTGGRLGKPLQAVYQESDVFNKIRPQHKIPFNPLGNVNIPSILASMNNSMKHVPGRGGAGFVRLGLLGATIAAGSISDLPSGVVGATGKGLPPQKGSPPPPPPSSSSSTGFNTDDIPSSSNPATGNAGSNFIPTASATSDSSKLSFEDIHAANAYLGKNRPYQVADYLPPGEKRMAESMTPDGFIGVGNDANASLSVPSNLVINEPEFIDTITAYSKQGTIVGKTMSLTGQPVLPSPSLIAGSEEGSNALLKQALKTVTFGEDGKSVGIEKAISGGDTGMDQMAILALARQGVTTGGTVPLGWQSVGGSVKEFALAFNMKQSTSSKFPARTSQNISDADGSILFYNPVKRIFTPDKVTYVGKNEILPFGSNLLGVHGKDAAKDANLYHGAIMGKGEGIMGEAYAIPTKKTPYESLSLDELKPGFAKFIQYAKDNPGKTSLLPAIGTNNAGFTAKQIVGVFGSDLVQPNITIPESFWRELSVADKGKYMSLHKDDVGPGRGSALTMAISKQQKKPFLENPTTSAQVDDWVKDNNISTVNLAGSRETNVTSALKNTMETVLSGVRLAPYGTNRTRKTTISRTASTQVQLEALLNMTGIPFAKAGKGDGMAKWIKKRIKPNEATALKELYIQKAFASDALPPGMSLDPVAKQYQDQPGIIKAGQYAINTDTKSFDAKGDLTSVFDISQGNVGTRIGTAISQLVKEGKSREETVSAADAMFKFFEGEATTLTKKQLEQAARLEKKGVNLKKPITKINKGVMFSVGGQLPFIAKGMPGSATANIGKTWQDQMAPIILEKTKTPLKVMGRREEGGPLEQIFPEDNKFLGEGWHSIDTVVPGPEEFSLTSFPAGSGISQSWNLFSKNTDFTLKGEFNRYLGKRKWEENLTTYGYPGNDPPAQFINPSTQNPLFYSGGKPLEGADNIKAFEGSFMDVTKFNEPITPSASYARTFTNRFGSSTKIVNPKKYESHMQGRTQGLSHDISESSGDHMKDKLSAMVYGGNYDQAFDMWKKDIMRIDPGTSVDVAYAKLLKTPDSAVSPWNNAMVMNLGYGTSKKAQEVQAKLMAQPRAQSEIKRITGVIMEGRMSTPKHNVKPDFTGSISDASGLTYYKDGLPTQSKKSLELAEKEATKLVETKMNDLLRLARSETDTQWRTRINASKEDVLRMFPSTDGFNQRSNAGDIEALIHGIPDSTISSVQDKKRFLADKLKKQYKKRMRGMVAMGGKGLSKKQLEQGDTFGSPMAMYKSYVGPTSRSGFFKGYSPMSVVDQTPKQNFNQPGWTMNIPKPSGGAGMGKRKYKPGSVKALKEEQLLYLPSPEKMEELAKKQAAWSITLEARKNMSKKLPSPNISDDGSWEY